MYQRVCKKNRQLSIYIAKYIYKAIQDYFFDLNIDYFSCNIIIYYFVFVNKSIPCKVI